MKIIAKRESILSPVQSVMGVVERRQTIPILANVLIEAEGDAVSFRATDLDIEVTDKVPAMVTRAGATTVGAHTLHEIVRKLPDGAMVELEDDGIAGRLEVRAGRSHFSLATLPREDFPVMASSEYSCNFGCKAPVLRRLFDKAKFAISTEETRYYLNGVYLHAAKNDAGKPVLRSVATDGHRLALAELKAPKGSDKLTGVIVPRKTVNEIRRLIDGREDDVAVQLSDTKIVVRAGRAVLTSKLIDGSFPDYARVIPKGNDKKLTVDNKAFEAAVDRVSTVSAERSRSVKMSLSDGRLTLAVNHAETGAGNEEIEAEYSSDPMEIGFNAKYLLDIAGQIEASEAEFMFNDPASPALVLDPSDESARYVLMPLRV